MNAVSPNRRAVQRGGLLLGGAAAATTLSG